MKIACISLSPMPYNTPILNALAQQADVHAIYLCKEDRINRFTDVWGVEPVYEHSFFPSKSLHSERTDLHVQVSLGTSQRLAKLRPDVVVVVSWKPVVIEPLLWTRWWGRGAVMWSESTSFSGLLRGRVSTELRRAIVRNVDHFVTNGSCATGYLELLGVPQERIVTSCLPGGQGSPVAEMAPGGSTGARFLYVGRLIPRKRPLELIRAFERVHRDVPGSTLTVVGQGELEAEVREAAERAEGVSYVGFAEGDELAARYAAADVLVLPALREVWGLVVNEALAHGLYVIATDEVGAAYDLLSERSGTMVPAQSLDELALVMTHTARTLDVSEAARRLRAADVADCTPEQFAADIYEAAELAAERRRSRVRSLY